MTWRSIARRYKDDRTVIVGYELLNEPDPLDGTPSQIAAGAAAWNNIAYVVASSIREIDRYHSLVIEPTGFASPSRIDLLDYAALSQIPGIVYSVHMYSPNEFSEQGTRNEWPFGADGVGGYKYPGYVDLGYTTNLAAKVCTWIDAAYLAHALRKVADFQNAHPEARIFIGEFGAIRWAPLNDGDESSAWRYLRDCMEIFGHAGRHWDWTVHAYNFDVRDSYTGLNYDSRRGTETRYPDTNKLRSYRHYVIPANDTVPPPAYDRGLPDHLIR